MFVTLEKNSGVNKDNAIEKLGLKNNWFVQDRSLISGYDGFYSDCDRIESISLTVPFFFFLVAALVCLTSMSRIVSEQRGLIGTLKSLGVGNGQIRMKFIGFALFASLIGAGLGIVIGLTWMTSFLFNAYGLLYNLSSLKYADNTFTILVSLVAAILVCIIPTIFSFTKIVNEVPAQMLKQKAPKPGARVLLERIPLIWRHLKFSNKVTVRNLLLNKARFFMTIVGVTGCLALLIMGLNLRSGILGLPDKQYKEIDHYDLSVTLKSASDQENKTKLNSLVKDTDSSILYYEQNNVYKISSDKVDGVDLEVKTFVPDDWSKLDKFITFNGVSQKGSKVIDPTSEKNGVILTEKLAKWLKVNPGDKIKLQVDFGTSSDPDIKTGDFLVSEIVENYVGHSVFIPQENFKNVFSVKAEFLNAYLNKGTNVSIDDLSSKSLEDSNVLAAIDSNIVSSTAVDSFGSLNSLIWVILGIAVLLLIVVLYILNSINISERERELATLKVLGFYEREVANYVYRETRILSLIGVLFGIIGGYGLTEYILNAVEVNEVMFIHTILPINYLIGVVITLVVAELISQCMRITMHKVDPLISLKSAE
jgi:putative ABC transport system permease protein